MDRKRIRLAAIVCSLMLFGSTCLAIENQIINGEFDAGIEPWQRSPGDGFTIEVVQDAGLSGTDALKIDVLDANGIDPGHINNFVFIHLYIVKMKHFTTSSKPQQFLPTECLSCCSKIYLRMTLPALHPSQ